MRFLRSKRGLAVVAALVLILFLFRPGVYRLRTRISTTIGSALGRRVTIDNVHFHVLPRPGFDLEGLVIYDDPEFSAEPMIRADEVFAAIRFRSLLHGRLEIATLSANEPSINLVRNDLGRWNLASLLERNAQIPAAPTAKTASEHRPVFPYLEASGARINFKLGQIKKAYALMDADVALWQDSDNSWAARIKAEPVRTDFHLTDTGLVQINATWRRSSNLRLTPLEITVQWRRGQLGQVTQLLSGNDKGWRGDVNFDAKLSGTPEALRIESQAAVEDFRRYDIVGTEYVRLGTTCSAMYNAVTSEMGDLLCESAVGGGSIRLRGTATLIAQPPAYDLTLEAKNVPLTSVVRLLRHTKKQIPGDLAASGLLNAEFRAKNDAGKTNGISGSSMEARRSLQPQWTGTGAATDVRVTSKAGADEIAFGTIPLAIVSRRAMATAHAPAKEQAQQKDQEPGEAHLRIGPVALTMNGSTPLNAGGWISAAGYLFSLRGDTELKNLFRLERVVGLTVARPAAEGIAKLDVNVSGAWRGFAPPGTLGTAQLRNVRAEMRGLNTPIEIGSASIALTSDAVLMQRISARTGNTHWSGGVTTARHCSVADTGRDATSAVSATAVAPCVFQFDLTADQFSADDIAEWLTPHPAKRPWYRILNSDSDANSSSDFPTRSQLPGVQAHGILHLGRFGLKKLTATQVVTQVEVDRGKITLSGLHAQLLQGTHQGKWVLDVSSPTAATTEPGTEDVAAQPSGLRFHGTGALTNISLERVGTLMNDAWIAGTGEGNFDVSGTANSFREVLGRSEGTLQFTMHNGALTHVEIPGSASALPVHRFSGDLELKKGVWELSGGKLESRDGLFQASGTASPGNGWDFVLRHGDDESWALTGTLAKPHVASLARTEAKRAEVNAPVVKP